jgi:glutathione S-transferase
MVSCYRTRGLLTSLWSRGVPRREALLLRTIAPVVRRLVRAAYKITPESAQRSLDRMHGVFRHVEEQLSDGRRFLVGERFTAGREE